MKNPKTEQEWQEAADTAHVMLLVDAAHKYGFVDTSMKINVERCQEILEEAKEVWGIVPAPDAVERYLAQARS